MSDKDTRRDYARQSWRIRMGEAVQDALGMIVLIAMAAAAVWVCCAASGYHWE